MSFVKKNIGRKDPKEFQVILILLNTRKERGKKDFFGIHFVLLPSARGKEVRAARKRRRRRKPRFVRT